MLNLVLYGMTVLIWGSTWYAIKFQLGVVPPMVSVGYRFTLAAGLLFLWCLIKRSSLRLSWRDHGFLALQGFFLFCLNYQFAYFASQYLTSGINAVIFSSAVVFNTVNARLFFGDRIRFSTILGIASGLLGIAMVFWSDFAGVASRVPSDIFTGVGFSVAGAAAGSLGNMVAIRNHRVSLPIIQSNAFAMAYGAILTFVLLIFRGYSFSFDSSPHYLGSLLYLSVVGSAIAFGIYLYLLAQIGIQKASYALVITPIVALAISTVVENFSWTPSAFMGLGLVLLGNVLIRRANSCYSESRRNER